MEQHNRAAWEPANQQGAHTIGDLTMPPEVGDFSNILLGMIETTAHWLQDTPSIEAESLLAPAGLSLKHLGIDPAIKEPHGIKGRLGKDPNYVGRLMFETSQTLAAFLREHDGPRGPGEEASRQKKVACACLRASPAEGEAACREDTTAGLNGATYSAATWDEHCGEAEQAPSESDEESRDEIRGCTCLKEFPTRAERDRHIIETLEAGCHAITPDELPAMGGAYAWVDMWTGTALQCRAFQIHNEGKEESSTRGEAMTINQATTGLVELIGSGQLAAEDMTTVTISTDSEASVAATKSQVIKTMKTQQQSKSALATPMRNLTAIVRHLKPLGVNINVIHNYNEHGRGWDNEDPGSMTCRGNKACDEAAGAAAKASIGARAKMDHRAQPLDGGGATYLSTAAGKIEGDVKPVGKQLVGARMRILAEGAGHQRGEIGGAARAVKEGQADVGATTRARKEMSSRAYDAAGRALLADHPWTMKNLGKAARNDGPKTVMRAALRASKARSTLCPFCCEVDDDGEQNTDTRAHQMTCKHPPTQAAVQAWRMKVSERATRGGPCWHTDEELGHGCAVKPGQSKLAQECSGGTAKTAPVNTDGRCWDGQVLKQADAKMQNLAESGSKSKILVTTDRLTCLMAAWTGGREEADQATEAGLFKAAAAPLVKGAAQDLHAEGEVWAMPASVHPTLLTWIHEVLGAERQLATNPLLTTSGIFIGSHEGREGTSFPATVVASSEATEEWGYEHEDIRSEDWETTPWTTG